MKKDPNPQNAISRREILKRGTVASLGVALTALPSQETAQAATTLKGLAAAYDQYDALGLAELIAKKQITPLELLHAVRERAAAINPKINAICYEFFDKAEAYIQQGLPQGIFRGGDRHATGAFVCAGDASLSDACSCPDPLVGRIDQRFQFVVGHDPWREILPPSGNLHIRIVSQAQASGARAKRGCRATRLLITISGKDQAIVMAAEAKRIGQRVGQFRFPRRIRHVV